MEILMLLMVVTAAGTTAFVATRQRGPVGATLPRRVPRPSAASPRISAPKPAAVVAAQQRVQAHARGVAAGMQGSAFAQPAPYGAPAAIDDEDTSVDLGSPLAADPHALEARWRAARDADPLDDPRYADPRYDGRLAGDYYRGLGRERRAR